MSSAYRPAASTCTPVGVCVTCWCNIGRARGDVTGAVCSAVCSIVIVIPDLCKRCGRKRAFDTARYLQGNGGEHRQPECLFELCRISESMGGLCNRKDRCHGHQERPDSAQNENEWPIG